MTRLERQTSLIDEGVRFLKAVERKAHAKVNLFLEVLGERPDGYHEIETVMAKVALADEMSFRLRTDDEVTIACEGLDVPPEENLAVKAARLLKERAGSSLGLDIELRKNIPVGAGLGGGSSDAAAALDAANELWGLGLEAEELARVGAELGSDVPFFLLAHVALCKGRGEEVDSIPSKADPAVVLAHPGVQLSTKEVYARASRKDLTEARKRAILMVRRLGAGDMEGLSKALFNRLEAAAASLCPDVVFLKDRLTALGAAGAVMTGSGSAVAGLFPRYAAALDAVRNLRSTNCWVALTRFQKT